MSCPTSFNAKFAVLVAKHQPSHVLLLTLWISGAGCPCHCCRPPLPLVSIADRDCTSVCAAVSRDNIGRVPSPAPLMSGDPGCIPLTASSVSSD